MNHYIETANDEYHCIGIEDTYSIPISVFNSCCYMEVVDCSLWLYGVVYNGDNATMSIHLKTKTALDALLLYLSIANINDWANLKRAVISVIHNDKNQNQ